MQGFIDNERFRKLLLSFPGKAIQLLYDQYYRGLVAISEKYTHNRIASEDITQEAFIHIWQNHKQLGQYHHISIQHYIIRVVKNKSITFYKRNLRLIAYKSEYLNSNAVNASENPTEAKLIEWETYQQIRKLIDTFPRREKQCLLMKIDDNMTTQQIADELKLSRKAIERSLTSAHKRLRKLWASQVSH